MRTPPVERILTVPRCSIKHATAERFRPPAADVTRVQSRRYRKEIEAGICAAAPLACGRRPKSMARQPVTGAVEAILMDGPWRRPRNTPFATLGAALLVMPYCLLARTASAAESCPALDAARAQRRRGGVGSSNWWRTRRVSLRESPSGGKLPARRTGGRPRGPWRGGVPARESLSRLG